MLSETAVATRPRSRPALGLFGLVGLIGRLASFAAEVNDASKACSQSLTAFLSMQQYFPVFM